MGEFENAADVSTDIASTDATYDPPLRAMSCNGTGFVKVDTVGGQTVVMTLFQGIQSMAQVTKVYKTGTTATSIVGFW